MIGLLANSLVPVFVGLLFGYVAGLRKVVDNKDVKTLVSFLMTFALPCYLFVTMATTPRQLLWRQAKPALVFAIVYVALFVATYYAWRHLAKDTAANSAVLALTLGFPNAAAVAFLSSWPYMGLGLPSPLPLPSRLVRLRSPRLLL